MKTIFSTILGVVILLSLSACQAAQSPAPIPATDIISLVDVLTSTPNSIVMPTAVPTEAVGANTSFPSTINIPELESLLGYGIRQSKALPADYVLEKVTVHEPTRSVCFHYRHTMVPNNVILIAQGPLTSTPPLALIPGWPEYAVFNAALPIGGAQNGSHLSGWRRSAWACTDAAQQEQPAFSYALAPLFTWEMDQQQFDLYASSGGCGTPGGLTKLDALRLAEDITGTSTHAPDELDPDCLHTIADVEKLTGFDVPFPTYLPQDVAFYFATYQKTPSQIVTLNFLHQQHADMGSFFRIVQQTEDPLFSSSCDASSSNKCETLQIGDKSIVYVLTEDGRTEQLAWQANGFFFSLFRNAGEPGKIYKDELLKIINSLQ